jgi:hypothetical protein
LSPSSSVSKLLAATSISSTEYTIVSRSPPVNLGNFLRRLALPKPVQPWPLATLREKLVKIDAKVTRHAKYVTFQLAEVGIPRTLFRTILQRIASLAIPPPAAEHGA